MGLHDGSGGLTRRGRETLASMHAAHAMRYVFPSACHDATRWLSPDVKQMSASCSWISQPLESWPKQASILCKSPCSSVLDTFPVTGIKNTKKGNIREKGFPVESCTSQWQGSHCSRSTGQLVTLYQQTSREKWKFILSYLASFWRGWGWGFSRQVSL